MTITLTDDKQLLIEFLAEAHGNETQIEDLIDLRSILSFVPLEILQQMIEAGHLDSALWRFWNESKEVQNGN